MSDVATYVPATIAQQRPKVKTVDPITVMRAKYDDLAAQCAKANSDGDTREVARLKQLKSVAFQAWKDALRPGELADKERARKRSV